MRLFLLALVAVPLSQAEATTVVTHSDARDCYLATLPRTPTDNGAEGLAACDRAIDAARDDTELRAALLVNRADLRLMMQDYSRTVADAAASIALEPDLSAAYLNLGAGLVGLRRYSEALPALEKAIDLGVTDRSYLAYFNSAIAKEQLGDARGAYNDYKKVLEMNPDFVPAKEQLSRFKIVTKSQ